MSAEDEELLTVSLTTFECVVIMQALQNLIDGVEAQGSDVAADIEHRVVENASTAHEVVSAAVLAAVEGSQA